MDPIDIASMVSISTDFLVGILSFLAGALIIHCFYDDSLVINRK